MSVNNTINWNTVLNILLSPAEAALLAVIWERYVQNHNKPVQLTNKTIEVLTNVPASSVYKTIGKLERLNLIGVIEERSNNNSWLYMVEYNEVNKVIKSIKSFNPNNEPITYSKDNTITNDMVEYCESYRKSCKVECLRETRKNKGKRKNK